MSNLIALAERGYLPDGLLRVGIRRLVAQRLASCQRGDVGQRFAAFRAALEDGPIAPVPEMANAQHYEVPPDFFGLCLGPHRKYSCCLYDRPDATLEEAEAEALSLACVHAGIEDGMSILELGCGWGSLTFWLASRYPQCRIRAVSNSNAQRQHIEAECARRGLGNVVVETCDMNVFDPAQQFDRVVSIEMFEHMRNWPGLLRRIASWLAPGGQLFVHVFCHRAFAYPFETAGSSNWMAQHFFTGGIMPSEGLLAACSDSLSVEAQWFMSGEHYQRTAESWLKNLDLHRAEALAILEETYGTEDAPRWLQRWRMFYLSVAEMFGYRGGTEWGVCHYRLSPKTEESAA